MTKEENPTTHSERINALTARLEAAVGDYEESSNLKQKIFAEEVRQNALHREAYLAATLAQKDQAEATTAQAKLMCAFVRHWLLEQGVVSTEGTP